MFRKAEIGKHAGFYSAPVDGEYHRDGYINRSGKTFPFLSRGKIPGIILQHSELLEQSLELSRQP
jgi:hypothetical protein